MQPVQENNESCCSQERTKPDKPRLSRLESSGIEMRPRLYIAKKNNNTEQVTSVFLSITVCFYRNGTIFPFGKVSFKTLKNGLETEPHLEYFSTTAEASKPSGPTSSQYSRLSPSCRVDNEIIRFHPQAPPNRRCPAPTGRAGRRRVSITILDNQQFYCRQSQFGPVFTPSSKDSTQPLTDLISSGIFVQE